MAVLRSIPSQQRQGSFLTPSFTLAADAEGTLIVRPVIEAADFNDPAKSIVMRMYYLNAASVWEQMGAARWVGTPGLDFSDPENHPIFAAGSIIPARGRDVRAEVEIPVRMRVGASLELV